MTIIDVLNKMQESDNFNKCELMQILSESVEEVVDIDEKIIEVYNAVQDTKLALVPNSIEVIDLIGER